MQYNHKILLVVAIAVPAAIYGAFSTPPLTTGGSDGFAGVTREEFDQAVSAEYNFCRRNATTENCQCFAYRSSTILTNKETRVRGVIYADKHQLARDQAEQAC